MEGLIIIGHVASLIMLEEGVESKSGRICKDGFVCLCLAFLSKGNEGMVNPGGKLCLVNLGWVSLVV